MRTIEVVEANKARARYDLETGNVICKDGNFYIIVNVRSEKIAVCLNGPATLDYDEIPLHNDLYQVTEVAKL